MPYELYKQGEKVCVRNSETGESKGCSASRAEAVKHMRLLYHVESGGKLSKEQVDEMVTKAIQDFEAEEAKEKAEAVKKDELSNFDNSDNSDVEGTENKELEEKDYGYEAAIIPSFGSTSYAQLEQVMAAREKSAEIHTLIHQFPQLASNIMYSPEIDDKAAALRNLASELSTRVSQAAKEKALEDAEEHIKTVQIALDSIGVVLTDDMTDEQIEEAIDKAISKRSDVSEADKKRAVGEYGNVTYADTKNKKYPIDTPAHIRAAWNYINKRKNAAKYSPEDAAAIKSKIVAAWKSKIDKAGPPSAAKEVTFLERAANVIKGLFVNDEPEGFESPLLIWKEGNRWFWFARYSNNFRDRDNPPEIISADSHRRFVERVEKGLAPYPELWLWHVPQWNIGKSSWVGYDDAGFALAAGYFHKGCGQVAEWLSKQRFLVSHGMPPSTIRRDESDKSVIIEHESREISPLPAEAAANLLTGFVVHTKEANNMAIPQKKKDALINQFGLSEKVLATIESLNETDAEKAVEAGIESKEKNEDGAPETEAAVADATQTESVSDETSSEEETTEEASKETEPSGGWRKEVAESMTKFFLPILEKQNERIEVLENALTKAINELVSLRESDEDKIVKTLQDTPGASLAAMLSQNFRAVGNKEAQVDGRTSLSKQGPKEAEVHAITPRTAVPFLDDIIATQRQPKQ